MQKIQQTQQASPPADPDEIMKQLAVTPKGLSNDEVQRRLAQYGPNEIPEKKHNAFIKFLGYLWGPIPWMIEAAAVLSLIVRHWVDFFIVIALLLFNAAVGFWQEYQAGNAVEGIEEKTGAEKPRAPGGHMAGHRRQNIGPRRCDSPSAGRYHTGGCHPHQR